jgi:hypothetical protein
MSAPIQLGLLLIAVSSAGALAQPSRDRFAGIVPRPDGPLQFHGSVGFIAPAGWTVQKAANGATILTRQVNPQDRPCMITMLPPMRGQGDPATQGAALVQSRANADRLGAYLDSRGRDVRLSREDGISGAGWTYTDLSGQIGKSGITARVLMVQMGDQVLPIVGFSKVWNCLGNQATRENDVWALLFHSLRIPGYDHDSPQLAEQLIGMWSSASNGAGTSETFAPNGHFGTVAVYQSYERSTTPGMVWEVNRAWQGDGTYEVHGDRVHTHNARPSAQQDKTQLFSIVRTPNENAPGGFDVTLRILTRSWDGSPTWGFSPSGNYVTHMKKSNPSQ